MPAHVKTLFFKDKLLLGCLLFWVLIPCGHVFSSPSHTIITASWYSIEGLKKEGTWKTTKGVMANGETFDEHAYTCATWLYPFGATLRITNLQTDEEVVVVVTDRIGRRFAETRIDLSKAAFAKIADLKLGLVKVKVERIE